MKKDYIAPQMELITMEPSNMLASSVRVDVFGDEKVDASESLSNDRRGEWGDLWAN
jgi:hypothetical protein